MAGIAQVSVDVLNIDIGPAGTFRTNINTNFSNVKEAVETLSENVGTAIEEVETTLDTEVTQLKSVDTQIKSDIQGIKSKGQVVVGSSAPDNPSSKDIWLQVT